MSGNFLPVSKISKIRRRFFARIPTQHYGAFSSRQNDSYMTLCGLKIMIDRMSGCMNCFLQKVGVDRWERRVPCAPNEAKFFPQEPVFQRVRLNAFELPIRLSRDWGLGRAASRPNRNKRLEVGRPKAPNEANGAAQPLLISEVVSIRPPLLAGIVSGSARFDRIGLNDRASIQGFPNGLDFLKKVGRALRGGLSLLFMIVRTRLARRSKPGFGTVRLEHKPS